MFKLDDKLGNADAMCRLPLPQLPTDVPLPAETVCLLEFIDSSPIHTGMIKYWADKDPLLSRVCRLISSGWSDSIGNEEQLQPHFS